MIGFDATLQVMEGVKEGHRHKLGVGPGRSCQKKIDWHEYGRGNYVEEHLTCDSRPLQACEAAITVWAELIENHPGHPVFDKCH